MAAAPGKRQRQTDSGH